MTNSGDDESSSLMPVDLAWNDIDFDPCNDERLEVEEEVKEGRIKKILRCVGIKGKP